MRRNMGKKTPTSPTSPSNHEEQIFRSQNAGPTIYNFRNDEIKAEEWLNIPLPLVEAVKIVVGDIKTLNRYDKN